MHNLTNHSINNPYIKFHLNAPADKYPKPVIPLEKYYKDKVERERDWEHESVCNKSCYGLD